MHHVLKVLRKKRVLIGAGIVIGILLAVLFQNYNQAMEEKARFNALTTEKNTLDKNFANVTEASLAARKAYLELKDQDQYKINQQLIVDIDKVQKSYKSSITAYEKIQDLKIQKQKTDPLEKLYVEIVKELGEFHYATAEAKLTDLNGQIKKINDELAAASGGGGAPAKESNTPPGSGFSYQAVKTDIGTFNVAIVAADLSSTRVVVDTATDGDCRDNCPVLSLGDYVARSGAYAGINGSYFCPASYPSCTGKTNSFDTLVMNKNKKYINSDNNVYSTVPVAIFGSGYARFIGASSGWGRDTGVDGVIANQPLLLSGGNITFGGGSDPKQGSKGARSFVGNKGGTVYIGVVYNATVAEVAHVLKALALENALNLDSGGSTALWSGGYKAGPGRAIPNAILFIRR